MPRVQTPTLHTNNDVDRCINIDVIFNNGHTFAREINAVVVMVTHANCVSSGAETRIHESHLGVQTLMLAWQCVQMLSVGKTKM